MTLMAAAALAILAGGVIMLPDLIASSGASEGRVRIAARLGVARSDLWARAAEMASGPVATPTPERPMPTAPGRRNAARDAQRALQLSPLLSRPWLYLAAAAPVTKDASGPEAALTMAFFTGPSQRADVSHRLDMAAQLLALEKPELCDLLRGDVNFTEKQAKRDPALSPPNPVELPAANRACLQRLTGLP